MLKGKNYKHGGTGTKLHNVWRNMKKRIINSNERYYKYYGGRGITICPEWTDKENGFINFRKWSVDNGYANNLFLDRENPDGNYSPENCRWVTVLESNRNKRNTIDMQIANEIRTLYNSGYYTQKQLAEKYNMSFQNISLIVKDKIWINHNKKKR